jgi:hypothetical protein
MTTQDEAERRELERAERRGLVLETLPRRWRWTWPRWVWHIIGRLRRW